MRSYYTAYTKDQNGRIIASATVNVYLAGTTTAASIYTTLAGATAVNSVTSDANGKFEFYVSRFDYDVGQQFKLVISKAVSTTASYANVTLDYIQIDSHVLGTYTISVDTTVTTTLGRIPEGVIYSVASGKTLTITGTFETGNYQVFTGTGTIKFGVGSVDALRPEWWGAVADGSTDSTTAISSALYTSENSISSRVIPILFGVGEYITTAALTMFDGMTFISTSQADDEYDNRATIANSTTDIFVLGEDTHGVSIRGIYFEGDSVNKDTYFLTPVNLASGYKLQWSKIVNCGFKHFSKVFSARWTGVHFTENFVNNCPDGGLKIAGSDNIIADNFLNTGESDVPTGLKYVLHLASANNNIIRGNYITGLITINSPAALNDRIPLYLESSDQLMISGNWFDYNNLCAIYATGSDNISLVGNTFRSNAMAPSAQYTGVITAFDVHSWAITGNNYIAPASLPAARRLFVFRHSSLTSHDIYIHGNTYDANEIAAPAAQELFTVDAGYASNIIWQETYDRFRRWSNTGTVAIAEYMNGRTFDNIGAGGITEYDLPTAVVGTEFSFLRIASFALRLDPNGTEVIRGGGAGKYLSMDTDRAYIKLKCYVAGTWDIIGSIGTITYEP